jgi:ABC-type branched-subunit amino acid transport system permease subunit
MKRLSPDNVRLLTVTVVGLALLVGLPAAVELFTLLQITLYCVLGVLAMSLAFTWGYAGILCFGQSVFFGLGAYAYAVSMINIHESTLPILLAVAVPALFAIALGYFMFYARISDVYVGVVTLTVTLIFYHCVNATAGAEYHIGEALLGGFNGMPSVPTINIPFSPADDLSPEQMFYLAGAALLGTYICLSALLRTRFGRVLVAIRENEQRVELLGYDVRFHKLMAFAISGAIAGLSGCLFASWGNYVSPTTFSVVQSAQIIIWLMVGGVGTLLGPVLGCFLIAGATAALGTQQLISANVALGAILLFFVLLVPRGLAPLLAEKVFPELFRFRHHGRDASGGEEMT